MNRGRSASSWCPSIYACAGRGTRPNRTAAGGVILSNMSSFSEKGLLGELEQLVLLAALRLDANAYAVSIRDEIHDRTGIHLGRSTVYVTLDRLERKGYMASALGDPTPERGGKAKRCFTVTAAGRRALANAQSVIALMQARKTARDTK